MGTYLVAFCVGFGLVVIFWIGWGKLCDELDKWDDEEKSQL